MASRRPSPAPRGRALALALVALWSLAAGCSGHDGASEPRTPAQAPPTDEAPDLKAQTPQTVQTPPTAGPPVTLVGQVHEDGLRLCEADTSDERWVDKFWQVGWVGLVLSDEQASRVGQLRGAVVKVRGVPTDASPTTHGGDPRPETPGMCPEYQMRSDWRLTAEGMRIPRGHGPAFDALEVSTIEVVTPIEASRVDPGAPDGGDVEVVIHNPFEVALADVEVIAHYEGCYGKPGATAETWRVGKLAAGADTGRPHRFPARIQSGESPRGRDYALRTLELVAADARSLATVFVDLDLQDRDGVFAGSCL